ncbi:MAG: putative DNA binding domain-containing protein [Lachnospiraceae bacterium]|nr:putative DNA binding domain-containing protein [Lachnospiraceae bacterium]
MSEEFNLSDFDTYKEDNCREVKKAEGGLPLALWETYSSFANSNGGVIILGVGERSDGSWYTTGLKNASKLKKNFWNTIHDTKKVSINLLSDNNVKTYNFNGDTILVITVPPAKREQKPVYINNDLFGGSYRRDWDGDYHCSKAEVKAMLRDATEDSCDMKIVKQFNLSVINHESLESYRNFHRNYKPEHVFHRLSNEEYLLKIGAAAYDENGTVRPTIAGLLMFGEEYNIVREFPEYFLDYRELVDPTTRWTDRVQSSSGEWTGNIQDFFFRVNSKISQRIKTPFKLNGITRIGDTNVHKAIREALVNCLVNADYYLPQGIIIKNEYDSLIIQNPGNIRPGKKQMLRGGISDPRNKTLMKMFNLIGIGERAGSGIPDIYQTWEDEGWVSPIVEESFHPDRTTLTLKFANKQSDKTSEVEKQAKLTSEDKHQQKPIITDSVQNNPTKQAKTTSEDNKRRQQAKISTSNNKLTTASDKHSLIREYLSKNGSSKPRDIAEYIGLSMSRTRVLLSEMPDVTSEGSTTARKYKLSKKKQ